MIIYTDSNISIVEFIKTQFPLDQIPEIETVKSMEHHPRPGTEATMFELIKKRLEHIMKTVGYKESGAKLYTTIEKGYKCIGLDWYLIGGIGISVYLNPRQQSCPKISFTHTIPLSIPTVFPNRMQDPRQRYKLLRETYPDWDPESSIFEHITGKPESKWYEEPIKEIIRGLRYTWCF